jgi:hypothetical protein
MESPNLNDVYEFTRGELNAIVNGLAKAPAEDVFQLINSILAKLKTEPSKVGTVTEVVQNNEGDASLTQ